MPTNTTNTERRLETILEYFVPKELRAIYLAIYVSALIVMRFKAEPGNLSWEGMAAATTLTTAAFFVGIFQGSALGERERWGWPVVAAVIMAGASAFFTVAKIVDVGVFSWFDFAYQLLAHASVGFLLGNGIADKKPLSMLVAGVLIIAELIAMFMR